MAYRKVKEKNANGRGIDAEMGEKIMRSARMGNLEETEEVLKWWAEKDEKGLPYGGNIRINTSVTGAENFVLRKAVEHRQAAIVELMIKYKADPNVGTGAEFSDQCHTVQPPVLHMAAQHGDVACLQLLLDAGANVMVEFDARKAKTVCPQTENGQKCYDLIRAVELVELDRRAAEKEAKNAAAKAAAAAETALPTPTPALAAGA